MKSSLSNSIIHLNVPAATKGRWIQASRAAGMRLTDFISTAVESYMQQQLIKIAIPDDVKFSDLHLARTPDGSVSFDWAVIEQICHASKLPVAVLRDGPEDNVAGLITHWYMQHLQHGGARDVVADDLIGEVVAEDAAGQTVSHAPGSA